MNNYAYKHPELPRRWHTQAEDKVKATKRFEDSWALRIPKGLLEEVDGSFFDGTVSLAPPHADTLCPDDLAGHMLVEDKRPARREFTRGSGVPVVCILCNETGWSNGASVAI